MFSIVIWWVLFLLFVLSDRREMSRWFERFLMRVHSTSNPPDSWTRLYPRLPPSAYPLLSPPWSVNLNSCHVNAWTRPNQWPTPHLTSPLSALYCLTLRWLCSHTLPIYLVYFPSRLPYFAQPWTSLVSRWSTRSQSFFNPTIHHRHPIYTSNFISTTHPPHPLPPTISDHPPIRYQRWFQFARLRSPTQFATVQLLSSISVVIIFPLQMSGLWHKLLQLVIGYPLGWEEHADSVATAFYCRGLAQNITMVGFLGKSMRMIKDATECLGWLSILHLGPNARTSIPPYYLLMFRGVSFLPIYTYSRWSLHIPSYFHRFMCDMGKSPQLLHQP